MYRKIMDMLPPMLAGDELMDSLRVFPEYDENIINASVPERLMAMADLYNIYEPSTMSVEIYSKLYLGLIRSLQKKDTRLSILQQIENIIARSLSQAI